MSYPDYEKIRQKKDAARRKGLKHLSDDQLQAVIQATEALGEFVEEWTESYDIYNPNTPRKLQSAFFLVKTAFKMD